MNAGSVGVPIALALVASVSLATTELPEHRDFPTVLLTQDGVTPKLQGDILQEDILAAVDGSSGFFLLTQFFGFGPGELEMSIVGGNVDEDGGVSATRCDERLPLVTIRAVDIGGGVYQAIGAYRVPDEFNRGGDDDLITRNVTVQARYIPDNGTPTSPDDIVVKLTRPPLVLVHGIWSKPATWTFSLAEDPRLTVITPANYRNTNASHYKDNRHVVARAIRDARVEFLGLAPGRTSVLRVDVAGHSMGGLLARIYTTSANFNAAKACGLGPIRKLITLDSPHLGAGLANHAFSISEIPVFGDAFIRFMNDINKPVDQGAIEDLQLLSNETRGLRAVPVPSHAMIGRGGPGVLTEVPVPGLFAAWGAMVLFGAPADSDEVFGEDEDHDAVVSAPSQVGGMPFGATSDFFAGCGIHFGTSFLGIPGNTGCDLYGNVIFTLLDKPVAEPEWSFFPSWFDATAPSMAGSSEAFETARAKQFSLQASQGTTTVVIASPTEGTVVSPGEEITVVVVVVSDQLIERVLIAGDGAVAETTTPPYVVNLLIPHDAKGPYKIAALAKTTTGEVYGAESITVIAEPEASLTAIEIFPDPAILHGAGDEVQLRLTGIYDDGIERELDTTEATWASSAPSVVTVDADGRLTAVAEGNAAVQAQVGSRADVVSVIVSSPPDVIFADHFEDGDTELWSAATGTINVDTTWYKGAHGLTVDTSSGNPAFLRDDTPRNDTRYFGRFYIRPWTLMMAEGDEFEVFRAFDDQSVAQVQLHVRRVGGDSLLRWLVTTDTGTIVTPPGQEILLPKGWRAVEFEWRASALDADNGYLFIRVDGNEYEAATGIPNSLSRIDYIVLGVAADLDPGTSGDVFFDEFGSRRRAFLGLESAFDDVPTSSPFWRFVHAIYNHEVTSGCGSGNYCPADPASLEQTAAYLLRSDEGPGYAPPVCTSAPFNDVPPESPFCPWIQELANRGITSGCGGGNYCPEDPATREQASILLLKTLEGSGYTPPACVAGEEMFADVPASSEFCPWIEELARRGIASGCGDGNYCPELAVSRGQMAELLAKTFSLFLPAPPV